MDDCLAFRDLLAKDRPCKTRAEGQDHVTARNPVPGMQTGCHAAGSKGEGVALIKPGLPLHGTENRYAGEFGKFLQFCGSAAKQGAHTGPDHRLLCSQEQPHRILYITG